MRVAVNSHALPVYKKNRIASLLCIFETTITYFFFEITYLLKYQSNHVVAYVIAHKNVGILTFMRLNFVLC